MLTTPPPSTTSFAASVEEEAGTSTEIAEETSVAAHHTNGSGRSNGSSSSSSNSPAVANVSHKGGSDNDCYSVLWYYGCFLLHLCEGLCRRVLQRQNLRILFTMLLVVLSLLICVPIVIVIIDLMPLTAIATNAILYYCYTLGAGDLVGDFDARQAAHFACTLVGAVTTTNTLLGRLLLLALWEEEDEALS